MPRWSYPFTGAYYKGECTMTTKSEFAAMATKLEAALPQGPEAVQAKAIAPGSLFDDIQAFIAALKTGNPAAIFRAALKVLNDLAGTGGGPVAAHSLHAAQAGSFNWGGFLQILVPILQQLLPLILHP